MHKSSRERERGRRISSRERGCGDGGLRSSAVAVSSSALWPAAEEGGEAEAVELAVMEAAPTEMDACCLLLRAELPRLPCAEHLKAVAPSTRVAGSSSRCRPRDLQRHPNRTRAEPVRATRRRSPIPRGRARSVRNHSLPEDGGDSAGPSSHRRRRRCSGRSGVGKFANSREASGGVHKG
nr:unnamed protein product [Digitaria exilis]